MSELVKLTQHVIGTHDETMYLGMTVFDMFGHPHIQTKVLVEFSVKSRRHSDVKEYTLNALLPKGLTFHGQTKPEYTQFSDLFITNFNEITQGKHTDYVFTEGYFEKVEGVDGIEFVNKQSNLALLILDGNLSQGLLQPLHADGTIPQDCPHGIIYPYDVIDGTAKSLIGHIEILRKNLFNHFVMAIKR